ncbi:MAG: hypothetical protein ACLPJW_09425 [Rhodomicrobium sp.]
MALAALGKFRRLIEDARAMLGPDFVNKLAADIAPEDNSSSASATESATDESAPPDTSFNFSFDSSPVEMHTEAEPGIREETSDAAFRAPGDAATLP